MRIFKRGTLGLATFLVAFATTATAQHAGQLVIESVALITATGGAVLDRERLPAGVPVPVDLGSLKATVGCFGAEGVVTVQANLRDPSKVLDKSGKVLVQQKTYPEIRIDGLTGGAVVGLAAACEAIIVGTDKDKNGFLGEGTDQLRYSLQCKPGLATDLGLDSTQTAELEAGFGNRVRCTAKGVPEAFF